MTTSENAFFIAVSNRAKDVKSENNKQLAMKLATAISLSKNTSFLEKLNVSSADFVDTKHAADKLCLYSIRQIVNVVSAITKATERASLHDVSETVFAALRTMINFANADRAFTKADLCACIDSAAKISDDKKALIYRKKAMHDAAYANRQMTIALNVMRVLKMIKTENKFEYTVAKNNSAVKALNKLFDEHK